jgi:hypothetical protein
MGRVIPDLNNLELTITATNSNGDEVEIGYIVEVDRALKLTMLPEEMLVNANRIERSYVGIDYINRPDLYKIKDQEYLGTVTSLISDTILDIYIIKRKYKDLEDNDVDEQFLLLIPSLLVLDSVDYMELSERPYRTKGMVALVRTNVKHTLGEGSNSSVMINNKSSEAVESFLTNETVTITSPYIKGISLAGMSSDSMINTLDRKCDDGESTIRSDRFGMTQFLVLGRASTMFTTPPHLEISRLLPVAINKHTISNANWVKVNDGLIGISINI